jgi:biopolymer transport protein ExbD
MRREKRHIQGDVELNMAAMLDMAFQLLAFFILTYQPGAVEGCIAIRMPPPGPITSPETSKDGAAASPSNADSLAGAATLEVAVKADKNGSIATIRVAEHPPVPSLADFEQKLRGLMKISNIPFEQVLLKVSPGLQYENVLQVVEICARNKLTAGEQQTKLSIVEMP